MFSGQSSDLFIRDPLTKQAARVREDSLQVIGAFFSVQEKFTGNNAIGQQFTLAHLPVSSNVFVEITADGTNWTTFSAFTVAGYVITTTQAIPSSPANNVRITYFIASLTNTAVVTSPALTQMVDQLSTVIINTDLVSPNVSFEVGQLSAIIAELQGLSITIGDVNVNTDQLEDLTRDLLASNATGMTNIMISAATGFTNVFLLLGQEVSQLTNVQVKQDAQTVILGQEVAQLSQIITNTLSGVVINQTVNQLTIVSNQLSAEITQLSTLQLYEVQEVTQLSQFTFSGGNLNVTSSTGATSAGQNAQITLASQQVTELTDVLVSLAQEITQLSQFTFTGGEVRTVSTSTVALLTQEVAQLSSIITNTAITGVDYRPYHSQEITQLSTLELYGSQEVGQLSQIITNTSTDADTYLSVQEVIQLSNLNLAVALEVTQLSTVNVTLAQEAAQLSSLNSAVSTAANQTAQITVLAQEVTQLSNLNAAVALEVTQLTTVNANLSAQTTQMTTIELYESQQITQLTNLNTTAAQLAAELTTLINNNLSQLSQEITQLSNLNSAVALEVTQLTTVNAQLSAQTTQMTTIELYGSQAVTQLSNLNAAVALEVTQLTTVNSQLSTEITQLTTIELYGSQEVTQLSNLNTAVAQEIAQLSSYTGQDGSTITIPTRALQIGGLDGLTFHNVSVDSNVVGENAMYVASIPAEAEFTFTGQFFHVALEQNSATTAETSLMLINNPNASGGTMWIRRIYMDCVTKGGSIEPRFYISPTITANGTSVAPVSGYIKTSPATSVMKFYTLPTTTAFGTKIKTLSTGKDANSMLVDVGYGIVLAPNTNLLITGVGDANNRILATSIEYAETTP